MNTLDKIKKFVDDKYHDVMTISSLSSPEAKLICEIDDFIRQSKEAKTDAEWIDPEVEMPISEGIYAVITDENTYGIGGYWEDKEGKMQFEVLFATAGKEPHIKYWLKDKFPYLIATSTKI